MRRIAGMELLAKISLVAGIALPFWNIPLIIRLIKRKSSNDISIWWAWGVFICLSAMLPHGLITEEVVLRWFTISNFLLFALTLLIILIYHKPRM